jgi:hypothetical protein
VLEAMLQVFPEADIFCALDFLPKQFREKFKSKKQLEPASFKASDSYLIRLNARGLRRGSQSNARQMT